MFPLIANISDMDSVSNKKEIRKLKHADGTTTFCYMISNSDTFDTMLAKECRGITFDSDGSILHRPFHKFFNIGENSTTALTNTNLYNQEIVGMFDKMDGSMITAAIRSDGSLHVKSKKSSTSDVAIAAKQFISDHSKYEKFIRLCSDYNTTPIFEFTSPRFRIVLPYEKDCLTLLNVRHNFSGEYINLKKVTLLLDIPIVEKFNKTISSIINEVKDDCDKEGYVIQFKSGEIVKLKTQWYLDLHRTVTFIRVRDVVKSTLNDNIDDLISSLSLCNKETKNVIKIRNEVVERLISIEATVDNIVRNENNNKLNIKDFAIKYKNSKLFNLLILKFRNRKINYLEFFSKNYLKEYSLEIVV